LSILSLSFTVLICLILYRVNLLSLAFQWPILALCLNYIIIKKTNVLWFGSSTVLQRLSPSTCTTSVVVDQ